MSIGNLLAQVYKHSFKNGNFPRLPDRPPSILDQLCVENFRETDDRNRSRFEDSSRNTVPDCHCILKMVALLNASIWLLLLILGAVESKKPKNFKAQAKVFKMPDLNTSFYKIPFSPCKPLKKLNPVEEVRAQNYATKVFAACGPQFIIKYATMYKVPASGSYDSVLLTRLSPRADRPFPARVLSCRTHRQ